MIVPPARNTCKSAYLRDAGAAVGILLAPLGENN
jgi:hypothetical protein